MNGKGEKVVIGIRRQKTGVLATLPLHPDLRGIIEATAITGTKALLVTASGKSYLPNNLSDQFRVWCNEAGIPPQYSTHGLRHAMGDLLAELGASPNEVAAVLAHASAKTAIHYTQGADRKSMAGNAMARVIGTNRDRSDNLSVWETTQPRQSTRKKLRSQLDGRARVKLIWMHSRQSRRLVFRQFFRADLSKTTIASSR